MKSRKKPDPVLNGSRSQTRNYFIAILVFVFLLYGNSIRNGYSLDDSYVTVTTPENPNNSRIEKGISGIPKLFSTHYVESASQSFEYRPLVLVTFAIEYQFFGSNAHISHFVNVSIYAITCLLLFSVLLKLFRGYNIVLPLLITFLFVAHPIHTEVVDNIKCRDELLSFLFGISSLYFFLKNTEETKRQFVVWGILFLFFSLLCKRTAILFMAVIPLTIYFFSSAKFKQIAILCTFPIVALLLFRLFKWFFLRGLPTTREFVFFENPLFFEQGFLTRLPTAFYSMGYYIKLLVFPYPLSCYYGYSAIPIAGWGSPLVIFSFLFYFAAGIYALAKIPQKNIVSYGILFFLMGIFPFANITAPVVGIVGERFIYFASFGFCIAVAYLLTRLFKIDPKSNSGGVKGLPAPFTRSVLLLLIVFSIITFFRNNKWKDELTLYRNDVRNYDNSCNLHYLIGTKLYPQIQKAPDGPKKDSMIREAVFHYKKALEMMIEGVKKYPGDFTTLNNIGTIYANVLNEPASARPFFKRSVTINPKNTQAAYNFAYCFEKENRTDSAIYYYERMAVADTKYAPVYFRLHQLYVTKKEYWKALESDQRAIRNGLEDVQMRINLGNVLLLNNDTLNGIKQYKRAVELEPNNIKLRSEVSAFLERIGYGENGERLHKN